MAGFGNPFQSMRMANILGSQRTQGRFGAQAPPPVPRVAPEPEPEDDASRYYNDMTQLQSHVGPGIQAYRKYLSEMPNRNDYRPGVMNRIAAALSGFSAGVRDPGEGIKVAQDVNESPFRAAMGDYVNRGVGLKEQANMEQDELDSKLRMLQNARAMGLKYDEFKLKQLESSSRMNNDRMTAEAAQTRAQAYAENMRKPGYDSVPQQDGSVLYINQRNPQDRITVPAHTVAAGQLGVARQNAATNVRRANTYDRSVSESARHNLETEKQPHGSIPSPNAQEDAETMALEELALDPDFADYVAEEGGSGYGPWKKPGYKTVAPDDGSEEYKVFLDALNAKTREILSGKRQRTRSMGR